METSIMYNSPINGCLIVEEDRHHVYLKSNGTIVGSISKAQPQRAFGCFDIIMSIVEDFDPRSIFMIGHGIGVLTRRFENTKRKYLVAELDPMMVDISKEHFQFKGGNIHIGDGFQYLKNSEAGEFDCIILDAHLDGDNVPEIMQIETLNMITRKLQGRRYSGEVIINFTSQHKWAGTTAQKLYSELSRRFVFTSVYREETHDDNGRCNYIMVAGSLSTNVNRDGWSRIDKR